MSTQSMTYLIYGFGIEQREMARAFDALQDEELVEDMDALLIDTGSVQPVMDGLYDHMYFGMIEDHIASNQETVVVPWEYLKRQHRYLVDLWKELVEIQRSHRWNRKHEPAEVTAFFDWLYAKAESAWNDRHDPERQEMPPTVWTWRLVYSKETM